MTLLPSGTFMLSQGTSGARLSSAVASVAQHANASIAEIRATNPNAEADPELYDLK
jgi:hypothetical protein